jgi:hypothetical protein
MLRRLRLNRGGTVRRKNYFAIFPLAGFPLPGFKVIYDLYCLVLNFGFIKKLKKGIIELRNTFCKANSQDSATGILIFLYLLNLNIFEHYSFRKGRSYLPLGRERYG